MPRLSGFITSLGLLLAVTTTVYAEGSGLYVGGIVGASLRTDTLLSSSTLGTQNMEFSPGYTFGGFLGYDFGNNLRLEGEISYRENEIRTGGGRDPQAGTSVMMFNGFYDCFPFNNSFEVYFGGGLGVATTQLETISLGQNLNEDESVFAYQLETGFGWNYNPQVNFSLGYRFFDSADPEFVLSSGSRIKMELENHELILKMRYLFNL
ncbi:MAG: porin family protein [Nitrospinota bacterium]|nr:porin family protein [Nitrospinota bacterium]